MNNLQQRRDFLKKAVSLGGGVALLSTSFMNQAFANQINTGGYKALICLDLDGGNDGTNMVVPNTDIGYSDYKKLRGKLALERSVLRPINPVSMEMGAYGLHPALPVLQKLFNQGDVAILANVGTLIRNDGSVGGTPKRASHSNQRQLWQGLNPVTMATNKQGWMGRLTDLDYQLERGALALSGRSLWQTGKHTKPFVMGTHGPIRFKQASSDLEAAMEQISSHAGFHDNILVNEYTKSDQAAEAMSAAMTNKINENASIRALMVEIPKPFPNTKLGQGFATIMRSILARDTLEMTRQSFHIRRGGFDFHANHLGRQQKLLKEVDDAVNAFQLALEHFGLSDQVTTFTTSDFGRTTTNNGTGTAHGWGNHHFIIGGAVAGGDIYGRMPKLHRTDPNIIEKGILKPETSVDQYAATLALWFGASPSVLPIVLPNIHSFSKYDLGFMKA